MSITTEFKVQIVSTDADGNKTTILPALSAAITGFEREPNDDDEDTDDGFIVSRDDDADLPDDDDSDDGDDDDEADPEDEDQQPDAVLYLTTSVSKEVTADMATLRDMPSQMLNVRFIFGDGVLVREFEVDSDMWVSLNECAKSNDPLTVVLGFDIYDSRTIF